MSFREEFYLTLPSNGAISMQEFPNNKNNSWKTRLNRPIKLYGEWEVGLANISYPSESRLKDYLQVLKDGDILLKTGRYIASPSGNTQRTYRVTYGDIKNYQLVDLKDLLVALFKEEFLKVIKDLNKSDPLEGIAYNARYGQSVTTVGEDSFTINRSTLGSIAQYTYADTTIYVRFPANFLLKFDFVTEDDGIYRPTNNLKVEFADNTRRFHGDHRGYGISEVYFGYGEREVQFPYEVNATFLNLKDLSHKKSSEPRSLFIYCSLCDPQTVGVETQQLLCHTNYKPSLKGDSTYEPHTVVYRGLHTLQFDTLEIKIKEEDEEHPAKFASGACIVVLHLRRLR